MILSQKRNESAIYISLLLVSGVLGCLLETYFAIHLFLLLGAVVLSSNGGIRALLFFTSYTFLQNIFLICFSTSLTPLDTQLIIFYKELMVYLVAFFYIRKFGFNSINRDAMTKIAFFLLCLLLVFNIFRPGVSLYIKLIALRQILIPFICYIFGYSIFTNSKNIQKYSHYFMNWIIFLCLIGFIIYMANDDFWNYINYPDYFMNKNGTQFEGQYSNFYSHDFGSKLKRFVSFLADPIATSHLIGMSLFIWSTFFRQKYLKILIITISALLCFSKTLIFLLLTALYIYIYLKTEKRIYKIMLSTIAIIVIVLCFILANIYVSNLERNTAAGNHLGSLLFALNNNSVFGEGLGTVGFLVGVMGNDITIEYNESFFAMIIAQIGVIGAIFYYGYLLLLIKGMIDQYREQKNSLLLLAIILFSSIVFESVVSGSSIAMIGTGLYFIFAGVLVRNHEMTFVLHNKSFAMRTQKGYEIDK